MTTHPRHLAVLCAVLCLSTMCTLTAQQRRESRFARQFFTARPTDVSSVQGLAQAAAAVADAVKARDRQRLAELFGRRRLHRRWRYARELPGHTGVWRMGRSLARYAGRLPRRRAAVPCALHIRRSGSPPMRDDEMSVAVIAAGVRVRRGPATTSPILDTVSYAIVRRADDDREGAWRHVVATDGTRGYIADRYVSPITTSGLFTLNR